MHFCILVWCFFPSQILAAMKPFTTCSTCRWRGYLAEKGAALAWQPILIPTAVVSSPSTHILSPANSSLTWLSRDSSPPSAFTHTLQCSDTAGEQTALFKVQCHQQPQSNELLQFLNLSIKSELCPRQTQGSTPNTPALQTLHHRSARWSQGSLLEWFFCESGATVTTVLKP